MIPQIDDIDLTNEEEIKMPSRTYKLNLEVDTVVKEYNGYAEATGTDITLSNSTYEPVHNINIQGNTTQNSTTGKNKFAGADTTVNNGITFKKNSDGSYNITGTATAQANAYNYVDINNSGLVNGQTYTFWASQVLPAEFFVLIEAYNGTTWQRHAMNGLKDVNQSESQVINLTDTTRIRFTLRVNVGYTVNISNLKIQLESGSTATNFEKYTGGIASPNPQYEQPINSAGDNINLLENTYTTSGTQGGITHAKNTDGTMLLNGTATTTVFMILNTFNLAAGTYILSGCPNGGSENGYRQDILVGSNVITRDFGSGGSFTLNESTSIQARIRIGSGTAINNLTFKPMIIKGSIVKQYSPYGMGSINEVISNKNLFKIPITTINGITCTQLEDGAYCFNGTATADSFFKFALTKEIANGTNHVLSCTSNQTSSKVHIRTRNSSNGLADTMVMNVTSSSITSTKQCSYSEITIQNGAELSNFIVYPQLELGSSATLFVEHQEQNISIPCQQPMRSIGNVRDSFVKIDGVWYEKHKIGQVILNGSESGWSYDSDNFYFRTSNYTFEHVPKANTNDTVQLSNYFKHTSGWGIFRTSHTINLFYSVQNSGYKLCFRNIDITTVSDWTNWLRSHNVEVIYPTEEPYYLECTEEQITALENMLQCKTYESVTNINSLDITPSRLIVQYYAKNNVIYKPTKIDTIAGFIDNTDAIKQSIYHILSIERYAYDIYDDDYGVELEQYIGKDFEYLEATIQETLEEALTQDERILGVEVTNIEQLNDDSTLVAFNAITQNNEIEMEVVVNV